MEASVAGPSGDVEDVDEDDGAGAMRAPRGERHSFRLLWAPPSTGGALPFPSGALQVAVGGILSDPVIVGPSVLDDSEVLAAAAALAAEDSGTPASDSNDDYDDLD